MLPRVYIMCTSTKYKEPSFVRAPIKSLIELTLTFNFKYKDCNPITRTHTHSYIVLGND